VRANGAIIVPSWLLAPAKTSSSKNGPTCASSLAESSATPNASLRTIELAMLTNRYVLHLHGPGGEEIVRRASRDRLQEGDVLEVKGRGRWRVATIVQAEHRLFADGLAHCVPADVGDVDDDEEIASLSPAQLRRSRPSRRHAK
jgi:hypothetical protein